jgi:hypothetical protein
MIGIKITLPNLADRARVFDWRVLSPAAVWDVGIQASLFQDAAATTVVSANGDPVGCVKDLSGNGRHLTQATAASRPLYQAAGYTLFDQVDDWIYTQVGALNLPALWVILAFRSGSGAGMVWALPQDTASNVSPYFRYSLWSGGGNQWTRHINGLQSNGGTEAPNAAYVVEQYSGDGSLVANNTTIFSSGGATLTYPNSVPFYIGGNPVAGFATGVSRFYAGIACAAKPSAALRAAATKWLGTKVGLSL